ncbi:MAG: tetratricopeptide repeat protein, partial [Pseudomonadota bacterium]
MSEELRTEEEQVEAIKKWWSENGTSLILSVVVVAGGWFGWNTYQDNVRATGEAASAVYSQLVEKVAQPAAEQSDAVKAEMIDLAEQLKNDYSSTVYSQFGGLFLARFAADNGDFDTAASELEAVIAAAEEGPVKLTAQVRLANILVQLDKNDEALALIPAQPDSAYAAQF